MFKKILFFVLSLFYVNAFFVSLSVVAQNSISTNSNSDVSNDNSQKISSSSSDSATKKNEEKTIKVENKSKEENENANKNKYLPPADINSLTKKATAPEKKAEKKIEVNQKEALNSNIQKSSESQSENKVAKTQDNTTAKKVKENSEKRSVNEEKDEVNSKEVPDDLPDVDANEVNLPQVVAKTDGEKTNNNILLTIAAWGLIVIGILAFVFIILNGKYRRAKSGTEVEDILKGKRKKEKNNKLLPDKFYKI